jgi:hypothetical protein
MNFKSKSNQITTQQDVPLLIRAFSDFLLRVLVKDRKKYENNLLGPNFRLLKAVVAVLNKRVGRTQFKKVEQNPAELNSDEPIQTIQLDTEPDIMFLSPGMLLLQRVFTKVIRSLRPIPHRKSTFINLERIRRSVEEISGYKPSDTMVWTSIRSSTIQRRSREFLWKCIHNTFRVGDFWSHMDTLKINGRCHVCNVTESLEHIALECYSPEQKIIWSLTRQLWSRKYSSWPTLNWGLILGCNLVRFRTTNGVRPEKGDCLQYWSQSDGTVSGTCG